MNKFLYPLIMILLSVNASALAKDFSAIGKQITTQANGRGSLPCTTCHGANGMGDAAGGFPRLAGMNAEYLAKQLRDFAAGTRNNAVMQPIAKALNAQEVQEVANFYATQDPKSTPAKIDAKLLEQGSHIALLGKWEKIVPACVQCHGSGAHGVGTTFPALAGQHASYIEAQLKAWKAGTRKNDPNGLMKGIADRLSESEVKAVAAYLSSLKSAPQ